MFNLRIRICAAAILGAGVLFMPAAALALDKLVTLLTFNGNDGSNPRSVTADGKGNLFGTTHFGGNGECGPGSIYEMSWLKGSGWSLSSLTPPRHPGTSWQYQLLYDFNKGGPSINPNNAVFGKGRHLYGTLEGGDANSGAIFELR
ncbi:MAG TPA: hypothetical protein VGI20_00405 [Rhizomicrobium sp.]